MAVMADERSTHQTHAKDPNQLAYDESYYKVLSPHITGDVLDIGAGALMFVRRYIDKDEVSLVVTADKYQDKDFIHDKLTKKSWVCPEKLPEGQFDTIVSTEFIEHIEEDQLKPLLQQVTERLTDNGKFIGSTPNKVAPTTNPYHLKEYTLEELKEILSKYFTEIEIKDTGKYCTVWIAQK